ncbi:MAG: hypothetical protein Q8K58_16705 [Acidimicrobiales bacterium]|nr:hypothetical protein [Acidimicrobiales bacterium]
MFSQIIGSPVPGEGPITLNDPPRTARRNEINSARVSRSPLAALWPYASRLAGPDGTIPTRIRPDGLHLSDEGVREIADAWLFDTLGAVYREVVARQPAGLTPPERHAWS